MYRANPFVVDLRGAGGGGALRQIWSSDMNCGQYSNARVSLHAVPLQYLLARKSRDFETRVEDKRHSYCLCPPHKIKRAE